MDAGLLPPESTTDAPRRSMQRLVVHLDLFSGIGGFALAAQMLGGIKTVGFSEIDPYASQVLTKNFPTIPNHGDIRNINNIKADLITGGFPCQPFSSLGSRNGKEDHRYLWPEMLRVISESGCRWVCAENVPRIIGVALDDVLDGLESAGYAAWTVNIPACAVGAPHYRPRIWVVANRKSGGINGVVGECPSTKGAHEGEWGHADRRLDGNHATGAANGWPDWNGGSRVCRVADGVSNRIHALGNAIVPQVAAEILRCVMRVDSLHNSVLYEPESQHNHFPQSSD